MRFNHSRLNTPFAAVAVFALAVAAIAVSRVPAGAEADHDVPVRRMAEMHDRMVAENPTMAHMHDRMVAENPAMAQMHDRMVTETRGDPPMMRPTGR